MILKSIDLLGRRAEDLVSGFTGVIDSVSFDLYGCVQAALSPPVDAEGKRRDGHWFDVNRLRVFDERVMPVPQFAGKPEKYDRGPADKPSRGSRR